MTKKDPKVQQTNEDQDLQDLQEMLDEVKEENTEEESSQENNTTALLAEIAKLQSQLAEKDEIIKNAQLAYIRTKNDMDMLQRQSAIKAETMQQDTLIKIIKKIIPFVENLRKSLATLTDEQKQSAMGQWVEMVYKNFIKALAELSIYEIPTLHEAPDSKFHEPIGMLPAEDKKLKWKIIQIFEQGFFYQNKNWEKITINPSKVIIWE